MGWAVKGRGRVVKKHWRDSLERASHSAPASRTESRSFFPKRNINYKHCEYQAFENLQVVRRQNLVGPRETLARPAVAVPDRAPSAVEIGGFRFPDLELRAEGTVRVTAIHVKGKEAQVLLHANRNQSRGKGLLVRPARCVTASDFDVAEAV